MVLNCRIPLLVKFALKVGKAEFLGRALGRPSVTLVEDNYRQPNLEWFQIHRGNDEAGELLAAFQMFEVNQGEGSEPVSKLAAKARVTPGDGTLLWFTILRQAWRYMWFNLSLSLGKCLTFAKNNTSFLIVPQLNESEGTQDNIPPLPDARDPVVGAPPDTGPILPVPKGIRPTLAKYRYRWRREEPNLGLFP